MSFESQHQFRDPDTRASNEIIGPVQSDNNPYADLENVEAPRLNRRQLVDLYHENRDELVEFRSRTGSFEKLTEASKLLVSVSPELQALHEEKYVERVLEHIVQDIEKERPLVAKALRGFKGAVDSVYAVVDFDDFKIIDAHLKRSTVGVIRYSAQPFVSTFVGSCAVLTGLALANVNMAFVENIAIPITAAVVFAGMTASFSRALKSYIGWLRLGTMVKGANGLLKDTEKLHERFDIITHNCDLANAEFPKRSDEAKLSDEAPGSIES